MIPAAAETPLRGRTRATLSAAGRRIEQLGPRSVVLPLVVLQWLLAAAAASSLQRGSIVLSVLEAAVLLPLLIALVYDVGRRIAGRLFAAWVAAVWVVLPYAGLAYATPSLRHEYAHGFLATLLGLDPDPRFVAMVAFLGMLLFALRACDTGALLDLSLTVACAAAGAALAPRGALVAAAPAVALALAGRARQAAAVGVALAAVLAVVAVVTSAGWLSAPFAPVGFGAAGDALAGLRENFWSGRVLEWLAVAGAVGAVRGRLAAGGAVAFACLAGFLSIEAAAAPIDRNLELLRALLPVWPAVTLLVAAIPLLVPRGRPPVGLSE